MRSRCSLLPTVAACLALFLAAPARAEVTVGESLDWLVLSRPHVAVAEVVHVTDEGPDRQGYTQRIARLRRAEVLKGEPPEQASRKEHVGKPGEAGGPAKGAAFLLFFDDQKQISYAINLDSPTTRWQGAAFTTDFRVLGDRAAIMAVVNKRLKQLKDDPPKEKPQAEAPNVFTPQGQFLRLDVPHGTPAYQALFAGSSCFLIVPADPEHKAKLLETLGDPKAFGRARAAGQLAAYPGEDTVAALKAALDDPEVFEGQVGGIDADGRQYERKFDVYPVRQAAYEALRRLGVDVPLPEGYREEYRDVTRL